MRRKGPECTGSQGLPFLGASMYHLMLRCIYKVQVTLPFLVLMLKAEFTASCSIHFRTIGLFLIIVSFVLVFVFYEL